MDVMDYIEMYIDESEVSESVIYFADFENTNTQYTHSYIQTCDSAND